MKLSPQHISTVKLFMITAIGFILTACANEVAPTGGPKDAAPPKIVISSPPNKTVMFNRNEIVITFDEFIQPSGFQQTVISPPLDKVPEYKVKSKSLIIKNKGILQPNTTYTINFGDDLKDLNEGNILSNTTYVFSTGAMLDSQKVSFNILNSADSKPYEAAIISLYYPDSINGVQSSKPIYFTKTDKNGLGKIENVKAGKYRVFGLKDDNLNYIYDQPNESIGFLDTIITLSDSTNPSISFSMFNERRGKIEIIESRGTSLGAIQITFSTPISKLKIEGPLNSTKDIAYFNNTKDTLQYWYTKIDEKQAELYFLVNDTIFDTMRLALKPIPLDSIYKRKEYSLSVDNQQDIFSRTTKKAISTVLQNPYESLKLFLSRPVIRINDTKSALLRNDTTGLAFPVVLKLDSIDPTKIILTAKLEPSTFYSLILEDSILEDYLGTRNDSTILKFQTLSKESFGTIKITVESKNSDYKILELISDQGKIIKQIYVPGKMKKQYDIPSALAGNYTLRITDDRNKNGKWDNGNFLKRLQPESIISGKETYTLKGGWDLDIAINL
jgi:hypothetical protein